MFVLINLSPVFNKKSISLILLQFFLFFFNIHEFVKWGSAPTPAKGLTSSGLLFAFIKKQEGVQRTSVLWWGLGRSPIAIAFQIFFVYDARV
ncbi:MAG TPA: hypothetical protein DCE71_01440 [Parachlamydiales bacterium]|nr:hypothetical protein [Parachlamydiales bacterium]